MFSFDRLKINQIPLRENKRRFEDLTEFRDLLNDATGWNRTRSGDLEQQRIVINKRKPVIGRMIRLAGINTRRSCARRGPTGYSTTMLEVDVIEQMWELEALAMSTREPMVVIEEAIGEYEPDQKNARGRARNPFFWLALVADSIVEMFIQIVGWIVEIPVRLLSRIFRLDQEKAVMRSSNLSAWKKAIRDLGDSIQAEMHEAFAAGWNAFLVTHSGLLIAHGIKDFRIGFEQAWEKYWQSQNSEMSRRRDVPEGAARQR